MWRVIATDREGREIARKEIDAGEITLGRDGDRMLVLQSPSVSRRHCRLRADPSGLTITDDGSANGVLINGTRISPNLRAAARRASPSRTALLAASIQIGCVQIPAMAISSARRLASSSAWLCRGRSSATAQSVMP